MADENDNIECPNCAELVKKNAMSCRFCQYGLSDEHFRDCESCGERIKIVAIICRFCGIPTKEISLARMPEPAIASGVYGSSIRQQVFEVIMRQAVAGAPWRAICEGPMRINGITNQEIEDELARRNLGRRYTDNLPKKAEFDEEENQAHDINCMIDSKSADDIPLDKKKKPGPDKRKDRKKKDQDK